MEVLRQFGKAKIVRQEGRFWVVEALEEAPSHVKLNHLLPFQISVPLEIGFEGRLTYEVDRRSGLFYLRKLD